MAFVNLATLEQWVAEFSDLAGQFPGVVRVIPQDGENGADTGLVSATLQSVSTVISISPEETGSDHWVVTFESRDEPASLDAATIAALASELSVIGALCAYLERRARSHVTPDLP